MSAKIAEAKALQRTMNPMSQKGLLDRGSDLAKIHEVVNVFYVLRESHVDLLREDLRKRGFDVPKAKFDAAAGVPDCWILEAKIKMLPTLENLNLLTDQCVDLAANYKADYDGWYTKVMPTIH